MQRTTIAVSIILAAILICSLAQEYPEAQAYGPEQPSEPKAFESEPQAYASEPLSYGPYSPEPYYGPVNPKYQFDYTVQDQYTGVDFGHNEQRDGHQTNGQYHVQLPDGRLQKVVYNVDHGTGYLADVQYQGEAQFPEQKYPPPPAPYQ